MLGEPPDAEADYKVAPDLNDQARAAYEEWAKEKPKFTRCGAYYFTAYAGTIYQMGGMTIAVEPESLTDIDKMNGYEFKGGLRFTYSTMRTMDERSGNIRDWESGKSVFLNMEKKKGKWAVDPADTFLRFYYTVPCSKVSKLL